MKLDDNTKLLLACTAISLAGLIIMLISNEIGDSQKFDIGNVGTDMTGEKAVLCGIIKSKYDNGKDTVFLNLSDETGSISAIFFKDVKDKTDGITKDSDVCIEGSIQTYKGNPEIIGRRIVSSTSE